MAYLVNRKYTTPVKQIASLTVLLAFTRTAAILHRELDVSGVSLTFQVGNWTPVSDVSL